ncbi:MAG: flagellar biosynthetic protein FliR [Planctomycetes bacterium]|nr:flagellar biosynthetic protein FliR [Planctomycetota bacterium]
MDLSLLQDYMTSLFLHFVRVGAFLAVLPLFGKQRDSMVLRLALSTSMAAIFWWVGDQRVDTPTHLIELGVMGVREGLIGLALGFALSTMTSMLVSAGEFISSEMGFSLARTINPETGVNGTVISQLLQVVGFLLILSLDIHHEALRIMEHTFYACPVGEPFDFMPIWHGIVTLVGGSVELALQYSFPVLGTMMLISAGLVLLGRAVPAINLMEFAFALRILIALSGLSLFLVEGAPFLIQTFTGILQQAVDMFPG